jgi:hypothetical protein
MLLLLGRRATKLNLLNAGQENYNYPVLTKEELHVA